MLGSHSEETRRRPGAPDLPDLSLGQDRHRVRRLFKKGDLKYVILDLLKERSSHGYEIILILEERFHGLYSPNPGSIYPVLQLLEDMAFVTSKATEGRKVYTITDAGRNFLKDQKQTTSKIKGRLRGWWGRENIQYVEDVKVAMNYCRDIRSFIGHVALRKDPARVASVNRVLARALDEIERIYEEP